MPALYHRRARLSLPFRLVGIAVGAVVAATKVTLRQAASILPVGVAMGLIVMVLAMYSRDMGPHGGFALELFGKSFTVPWYVLVASGILMIVGCLAGFFVVPMNALLQHRGHVLLSCRTSTRTWRSSRCSRAMRA